MIDGAAITTLLKSLKVSHVVWVPDSALGPWEQSFAEAPEITLVRVCREGEAWALAAGLHLGGKHPVVMMQTTGLFESGDALRNVLFDLGIPLFAIIGYRSFLLPDSPDTTRRFAEPVLQAWQIPYHVVHDPEELPMLAEHYQYCLENDSPGVTLIAEGRM